jgi:hypothetical protein
METIIKVIIVCVVGCAIFFGIMFVSGAWRSQFDPVATVDWFLAAHLRPKHEMIATGEPSKIYQDGKAVGDVSGRINQLGNSMIFTSILNTSSLKTDRPFEYKRLRLKIVKIGTKSRFYVNRNDTEVTSGRDVLTDVVCERLDN